MLCPGPCSRSAGEQIDDHTQVIISFIMIMSSAQLGVFFWYQVFSGAPFCAPRQRGPPGVSAQLPWRAA
jgi:hypothetical protein